MNRNLKDMEIEIIFCLIDLGSLIKTACQVKL